MKKLMKKVSEAVCAAALILFVLCGCGGRQPVGPQEFETVMQQEQFRISETTDNYAAWGAVYAAEGTKDNGIAILYLVTSEEEEAGQLYSFMKSGIKLKYSDTEAETETSGSHCGKYTAVTENASVMEAFSDSCFILCTGARGDAGEIRKLAEKLGF